MNILSFAMWGKHDTSAAIVRDGVLVAAAEEERFTRRKHEGAFPSHAIAFCLRRAGLSMSQIDRIALPDKPYRSGVDSYLAELDVPTLHVMRSHGQVSRRTLLHKRALDAYRALGLPSFNLGLHADVAAALDTLRAHYGNVPPVRCYDHHEAHAAAAYLTSGLDDAAIATVDGVGGPYASVIWKGHGRGMTRLRAVPYPNSLGMFYQACTRYLGLGDFGEGKTMGLASYGSKEAFRARVARLLSLPSDDWYEYASAPTAAVLGFEPRRDEPILDPPFPDFAAAAQDALERGVHRVASAAIEQAGSRALCLGGGVMFNCSSNGALLRSGVAASISVFPASGDAGQSVGAALLCAAEFGEFRPARLEHAYWGPDFEASHCEAALADPRLDVVRQPDVAGAVAERLAAGDVVGWFQGRMELGPRALGNRSILADPRTVEMRDRVNRIKGREAWRPLAPVVLAERAGEFFELARPSPFMLFATTVRQDQRRRVPAVVHVDGSARPQTVSEEQNPRLHALISAFLRRTDVPLLLNTSFNAAHEPVVCTPQDAVNTFLSTDLDVLVLGDYVARRRDPEAGADARAWARARSTETR